MKRIILLLCVVLLLTGCDAVYNIEVKNNTIIESTNFYVSEKDNISTDASLSDNKSNLQDILDSYYKQDYLAFYNDTENELFYKKEKLDNGLKFQYTYSFDNYKYSSLVNYCFNKVSIVRDNNYYIIDLKDSSKCFSQDIYERFDKLTINAKINDVVESNADSISDGVYTWELSKNEAKNIYLRARISNNNTNYVILIISICVISAFVSFIAVTRKMEYDQKKIKQTKTIKRKRKK